MRGLRHDVDHDRSSRLTSEYPWISANLAISWKIFSRETFVPSRARLPAWKIVRRKGPNFSGKFILILENPGLLALPEAPAAARVHLSTGSLHSTDEETRLWQLLPSIQ